RTVPPPSSPSYTATAAAAVTIAIAAGLALGAPSTSASLSAAAGAAACPSNLSSRPDSSSSSQGPVSSSVGVEDLDGLAGGRRDLRAAGSELADATSKTVRVVNFNVYMGYDRRGEDNTFRVGRLLKDLEADIAGLQETGLMRLTLGNRHYAGAVARASGMVLAAAAPVAEDTWG
ncbi:unnamed protein product, partial [Ectocarpus sp. 4 AP-2014]